MPYVRYKFRHPDGSIADGELGGREDALQEFRRLMEQRCGFACEQWEVTRNELAAPVAAEEDGDAH